MFVLQQRLLSTNYIKGLLDIMLATEFATSVSQTTGNGKDGFYPRACSGVSGNIFLWGYFWLCTTMMTLSTATVGFITGPDWLASGSPLMRAIRTVRLRKLHKQLLVVFLFTGDINIAQNRVCNEHLVVPFARVGRA